MDIGFVRSCHWCDSEGQFREKRRFRVKRRGLLRRSYVCQECHRRYRGLKFFGIRLGWQASS